LARLGVVAFLGLAGCLEASSINCPDGTVCAADLVCAPVHGCAAPERVAACDGVPESGDCAVDDVPGVCVDGVCAALFCGDGQRTGNEQCDPALGEESSCRDRGFYQGGTIGCAANCTWDTASCAEFCGDGVLQAGEELCEESIPPEGTCTSFAFDAGRLGCSGCGADFAGCHVIGWSDASLDADIGLAVFDLAAAGDAVVAVGVSIDTGEPFAARWSGAWSMLGDGQLDDHLEPVSVWAQGQDRVWMTGGLDDGAGGFVASWDGERWTVEEIPERGVAIWALAPDEVFVLAGNGVRQWDGAGWSYTELSATFDGAGLWGEPDGSAVYAAGSPGGLFRYDGSWSPMAEQPPGSVGVLDVIGDRQGDLWAVSAYDGVYRWSGSSWVDTGIGIEPIAADFALDGDGEIFLLAVWSDLSEQLFTTIVQQQEGSWRVLSDGIASQTGEAGARALGGFGHHMFVFAGSVGFRYGGAAWWDLTPPNASRALAVWASGDDVYLVAQSRRVHHRDAGGWTNEGEDADFIDGAGDEVYLFDKTTGELGHRRGSHDWERTSVATDATAVIGMAVRGRDDVYFITDVGAELQHWDGSQVTVVVPFQGGFFADIHCAAGGPCAAAGSEGVFWSSEGIGSPTTRSLYSIWVAPDGQVFTGGLGRIWRHDGSGWEEMKHDSASVIDAIRGTAAADVFAIGGGRLVHFDGGGDLQWLPVRTVSAVMYELAIGGDGLVVGGEEPPLVRLERTYPW